MNRTYYTDYVRHALRFYSRNAISTPIFKSEADKQNWWSCHSTFGSFPEKTKLILLEVYSGHDTLPDEVYNASKKWKVEQNWIWDLMKATERKIAHRRGLM
jgi:hypothetical protein